MKIENAIVQQNFSNSKILIESNKIEKNKNKKITDRKANSTPFEELLFQVVPPEKEPELFELWSELPNVEQKLIQDPTEENLEVYKNLVQKIASQLIKKNLKLEQIKRKTSSGKEVLLSYVKIIDEKLHKMMLAIQSKKNTAFEILKNLKEIRGILIDLKQ